MCEEAPGLIRTFERMGVTFSRTPEGLLDLRLFGGVKNHRTVFAGASTGQQLLYGVDEQVRRYEDQGLVAKHEWWEFLSLVLDADGPLPRASPPWTCAALKVEAFPADAVILATGGLGLIFGKSTNSTNSTGAAASRAYQQGAWFTNGEFIQFHPTGMIGDDKLRLMSEASRGEGGRIWVPRRPGDPRAPRRHPGGGALLLPGGVVPRLRQHRAARRGLAGHLEGGEAPGARRRRRGPGLPRPDPPAPRLRRAAASASSSRSTRPSPGRTPARRP